MNNPSKPGTPSDDLPERIEDMLQYPCEIAIKAMGLHCEDFELAVLEIVREHFPELADDAIKQRPSRNGRYLSLSITVMAEDRAQMDAVYQRLSACEHVKIAI